ncbi:MAG: glycerophosphodiester phosphodiesterase [Actinomycetota bacterium]
MRIAAHRGNRLHAPENTLVSLVSAYTSGAQVLEFNLQLTGDGRLVISHDPTTERLSGRPGRILDLDLAELRKLDMSKTFKPRGADTFSYRPPGRRGIGIERFDTLLDNLPTDVECLIELKHDSSMGTGRRDEFVGGALAALAERQTLDRVVLYSKDPENLVLARRLAPGVRTALSEGELDEGGQRKLMTDIEADGLFVEVGSLLRPDGSLSEHGEELERLHRERGMRVGAVVCIRRARGPEAPAAGNVFTDKEFEVLRQHPFVWSLATDSMLDVAGFVRPSRVIVREPFAGTRVDTDRFSFGYAKANRYCHVFQEDGVHVKIAGYEGGEAPGADPLGPLEQRLSEIDQKLWNALRDWPFYSGGGFGLLRAIEGDFAAEVDYTTTRVGQATTLEMAVVNVNPGAHQPPWSDDGTPRLPATFRNKNIFFDPHGAPPFVGSEHDEDDGYRITVNLGSDYDSNSWGRPVGNGKALSGRLRLERRGTFFSAYFRNDSGPASLPGGDAAGKGLATDWVCSGVVRNESLNPRVYLRCAGKRWRQEHDDDPTRFFPVVPVEFVFANLEVTQFPGPP